MGQSFCSSRYIFHDTYVQLFENGHSLTGAAPTALAVVQVGVEPVVVGC